MAASMVDKVRFAVTTWGMAQLMRVQARGTPRCATGWRRRTWWPRSRSATTPRAATTSSRTARSRSRHGIHPEARRGHVLPGRRRGRPHPPAEARPTRVPQRRQDLPARGGRRRPPGHLVHHHPHQDAVRRQRVRRQDEGRHRPLHQQLQRRPGVRLRERRQDRPHHPDRVRRVRRQALDHQGPRQEFTPPRTRPPSVRTLWPGSRSSTRPTACSIP